jgi:hypothetical protein
MRHFDSHQQNRALLLQKHVIYVKCSVSNVAVSAGGRGLEPDVFLAFLYEAQVPVIRRIGFVMPDSRR